jgi:TolB-like protein/DNA-binding winged helix-turn-helix (wHTH) protein
VYDADLAGEVLRKGGTRIRLQPKPFRVLAILLEHAGTTVTRDELKKLLWAPDTFVDFDHGLNSTINKIREALNDSVDDPRFIETLPNGYRFIGEVERSVAYAPESAQQAAEPIASIPSSEVPRTPGWKLRYGVIGLVTIALVLVSLFAVRYQRAVFSQPKLNVKSIAVLPIRNLSGDPSQEYFSDSLTDELITQLAKRSTLRVVSVASVMRFKNTNVSVPEIARDLKVDAFVEGSVLRSGENVRITAQLIDAASDRHIWAEDYHGEVRDIMVLQNNIASAIVNKVQAGIAPSEAMKLSPPHRVDPRAYDAYMKGRGYWSRGKTNGKPGDMDKSLEQFRLAIQYDPNYAPAYAGLANYYGLAAGAGGMTPKDGWRLCEEYAQKALALDPSSAEAHLALASKLTFYDWDWAGAERELQISVASDPRYPEVHNGLSHFYAYMERFDESIEEARRAEDLDPLGQRNALRRAYQFSRRFDLYLAEEERTSSQNPAGIHEARATVYSARKQYAQEVKESDQALRLEGRSAEADRYARGYARGGYRGWLEAKLAEMKKDAGEGYIDNLEFASIYSALDNADMAMHYLEVAYREHKYTLARLQLNPAFDPLHSDPRYQDLIRRIGLPQQSPMTQ